MDGGGGGRAWGDASLARHRSIAQRRVQAIHDGGAALDRACTLPHTPLPTANITDPFGCVPWKVAKRGLLGVQLTRVCSLEAILLAVSRSSSALILASSSSTAAFSVRAAACTQQHTHAGHTMMATYTMSGRDWWSRGGGYELAAPGRCGGVGAPQGQHIHSPHNRMHNCALTCTHAQRNRHIRM
jgi:hypothetical protein